jgi:diamine N-acetyltransferase
MTTYPLMPNSVHGSVAATGVTGLNRGQSQTLSYLTVTVGGMGEMLRLVKITPGNVGHACRIAVRPEQDRFVAPVAVSLAEAYAQPEIAWPRLVCDGDEVVGFVMGAFDPHSPVTFFRCGIWRLNIAAGQQGRGYGRFAVQGVLDEARRRGQTRATVLWAPGPGGPQEFYLRLGFRPTGEEFHGQIVGEILLG